MEVTDLPEENQKEIMLWGASGIGFARKHGIPFPVSFVIGMPGDEFRFTIAKEPGAPEKDGSDN